MKEIPLTQGFVALVDDEDYERLACVDWHVAFHSGHPYAEHSHKGEIIKMARYIVNAQTGEDVHHIDGDSLNNQQENLHRCNRSEHMMLHKPGPLSEIMVGKMVKDYYDPAELSTNVDELCTISQFAASSMMKTNGDIEQT